MVLNRIQPFQSLGKGATSARLWSIDGSDRQVQCDRCLHGQAPQYLLDACQPVSDIASRRHIRSAGRRLLNIPRQRRSIFARRAFSVAGSLVWNSLRDYLRDPAVSRDTFCKHLKTLLFECIRVFTMMRYINLRFLWSPYGIGQTIMFSCCGLFFFFFFFLA